MTTNREIAERVAVECVTVEWDPKTALRSVRIDAPDTPAVYGWQCCSKDGAEEQAARVREVLSTVIANAIAEDRQERCANAMRENAELRNRVVARSVVMRLCPDCHEALHSIELGESGNDRNAGVAEVRA